MTSPQASFLDFFVLEATEYVDKLDGLLARAIESAPDPEALQRAARALRGSATMARLQSFAELASSVESVGRSLRAGTLGWDQSLKGALTAAVDDFKLLLRAARSWSSAEDASANRRIAELARYVQAPVGSPTPIAVPSTTYFGGETNAIATGAEALAARPDDRVGGLQLLSRVRALRGVAGVREVPALAEVTEAVETAVRPLELGDNRVPQENVAVLRASTDLLRAIAAGLAGGQPVTTSTPQYKAFLFALDGMVARAGGDRVVPIANLFYDDAGPHVVSTATNPPTTPAQRFRMEVVSLGEHLHRVIAEARTATDAIQQEHARGELGRALRAIRATAASFGQLAVAQTVESYLERTGDLNPGALDAISKFAATISPSQTSTPASQASVPLRITNIGEAVSAIGTQRPLPHSEATPMGLVGAAAEKVGAAAGTVAAAATSAATSAATTAAAAVDQLLSRAIEGFESLSRERFAEPKNTDDVVPIDQLLYRGRAALERAIEIRNTLRRSGSTPDQEMLNELYDLVELARSE